MTYVHKPDYQIAVVLTGNYDSPKVWDPSLNRVSFQMQWTAGLATGTLSLYGSNQALPAYGSANEVTYPPPLAPMLLAPPIDVSLAPYVTAHSGFFDVEFSCQFVWIHYTGVGGGSLSIAYSGKSFGS